MKHVYLADAQTEEHSVLRLVLLDLQMQIVELLSRASSEPKAESGEIAQDRNQIQLKWRSFNGRESRYSRSRDHRRDHVAGLGQRGKDLAHGRGPSDPAQGEILAQYPEIIQLGFQLAGRSRQRCELGDHAREGMRRTMTNR